MAMLPALSEAECMSMASQLDSEAPHVPMTQSSSSSDAFEELLCVLNVVPLLFLKNGLVCDCVTV